MGVVSDAVGSIFGGGSDAGDSAVDAAKIQADYQQQALDYLKSTEEIPQMYRESALNKLAGIYGLGGVNSATTTSAPSYEINDKALQEYIDYAINNPGQDSSSNNRLRSWFPDNPFILDVPEAPDFSNVIQMVESETDSTGTSSNGQQDFINEILQSPLYLALMSGKELGEETILNSATATGGLRSGNVQEALYDYDAQLQNQAMLQAYNSQLQGLQGMASLPSNANAIANQTSQIGSTLAQGITAEAQANQTASQNAYSMLPGLISGGSSLLGMLGFSDRRLKKNITPIGQVNGLPWYEWEWNSVAEKMGMEGKTQGYMADEVFKVAPHAVTLNQGFLFINYGKVGKHVSVR